MKRVLVNASLIAIFTLAITACERESREADPTISTDYRKAGDAIAEGVLEVHSKVKLHPEKGAELTPENSDGSN